MIKQKNEMIEIIDGKKRAKNRKKSSKQREWVTKKGKKDKTVSVCSVTTRQKFKDGDIWLAMF